MALLTDQTAADPGHDPELLIREARRRQRRRRITTTVLIAAAALGGYLLTQGSDPAVRSTPLLSRPLHLPSLRPGGRCPTSSGYGSRNSYFAGPVLGHGPVRVLLADRGDVLDGRVDISAATTHSWHAIQTLWLATPAYRGPFVVRAARIGGRSPIEVRPGGTGLVQGSGPLVVSAGPTNNTQDGYRTAPASTWVTTPGCYGWQVDGNGFSEVIVVKLIAAN